MTERDALLRAVAAAPADDLPRLVFADWLDDHDEPAWAEFIRTQCRLAALPFGHPEKPALAAVAARLEPTARAACDRAFPVRLGIRPRGQLTRGFYEEIATNFTSLIDYHAEIFDAVPVRRVTLHPVFSRQSPVSPAELAAMLQTPRFDGLTWLTARNCVLTDEHAAVLAGCHTLGNLTVLDIRGNQITETGARLLKESPALLRLRCLELSGNACDTRVLARIEAEMARRREAARGG